MPPRWLSLVIIASWLATTGWLIWRDLAPRFRTGDPPPYVIDLVEEVRSEFPPRVGWQVFFNDREVFHADTWVQRPAGDDSYELVEELKPRAGRVEKAVTVGPFQLRYLHSQYRVTREGALLALEVRVEGRMEVPLQNDPIDFTAFLAGEVRDGQFSPRVRLVHPLFGSFEPKLKPVAVSPNGSVLLPLHPVNRIRGLRPGQTWRMPLFDPLENSLPSAGENGPGGGYLDARVLPQTQALTFKGREVPCLVIEYQGDEKSGRTWVREDNGLVLRQEAVSGGERWVMQRD
jgi:hypothetical protein